MKKNILTAALAAVIVIPSFGAVSKTVPDTRPGMRNESTFRFMPKAKAEAQKSHYLFAGQDNQRRAAAEFPYQSLPAGDDMGWLDGPDGEVWYYVGQFTKDGNNDYITAYEFTIYNGNFEVVTTIKDTTTLSGNETGVRDVQLGSLVTRQFFNYSSYNYEFMVAIAANTTEFVNHYYTKVYTSEENQPGAIGTFEGYYADYVNVALDSNSEKYYIIFTHEDETTTPKVGDVDNPMDYVFEIYEKATWVGGASMLTDGELRVPGVLASGENWIPLISTAKGGKAYIAVNYLEKSYYEDPMDFNNPNLTADNNFIIDLKEIDLYGSLNDKSVTKIPVVTSLDDINYYSLGNFRFDEDVIFDRYTDDGNPSFVVTIAHYLTSKDSYDYTYQVYNTEGTKLLELGKNVEGTVFMSDVRGFNPQVMFIKSKDDQYTFDFVDVVTGNVDATIPYEVESGVFMTAQTDRIANGDSYLYVVSQTQGFVDENKDTWHSIVYIKPDGVVDHIDRLNLGPDVAYAEVYNNADGFNPYIFDTDNEREYMALVKHYVGDNNSKTEEKLYVVAPKKGVMFTLGPDETLGNIASISLEANTSYPRLVIVYGKDYRYTTVGYDLPFVKFAAGGDGTAENPYKISTIGDFNCISRNLTANYELANDLDASGVEMSAIKGEFKGVLDGKDYSFYNLELRDGGLFETITSTDPAAEDAVGGEVKNLNIVKPVVISESGRVGVISAVARDAEISNVHVYDVKVSGESDNDFGGLIGQATNGTTISGCSVENADINLPNGKNVGGLVGETRTGSKVFSSAFNGKIVASETAGGIVGSISSSDDQIIDCHVNADITAKSTIGGIAGSSERGLINRCHVEGRLEATTTEFNDWSSGHALGGIVGYLATDWEAVMAEEGTEVEPIITNCFVNLSEIKLSEVTKEPIWAEQFNTAHRIVGASCETEEPDPIFNDDWSAIIGYEDPFVEPALANNYAIVTLAKLQESVADELNTTEGKSIAAADLNKAFFEGLGYQFGTEIEKPWNEASATSPVLFFEGGMAAFETTDLTIDVDTEGVLSLMIAGVEPTDEIVESVEVALGDENILSLVSVKASEIGAEITVKGIAEGTTTVTATYNGKNLTANVTVKKVETGIDEVIVENSAISFDGNVVYADGCAIDVYNTMGVKMTSGINSCDLSQLERGIYVVVANDGSRRSTLKVCLK